MVGKNATDTSVLAKAMSTELLIIYTHTTKTLFRRLVVNDMNAFNAASNSKTIQQCSWDHVPQIYDVNQLMPHFGVNFNDCQKATQATPTLRFFHTLK